MDAVSDVWNVVRNCILCGEMICACDYCSVPDSLQTLAGVCDSDFRDVFPELHINGREDFGTIPLLRKDDLRVKYLLELADAA